MGKIYGDNKFYTVFRLWVDHCARSSYRVFTMEGKENIPEEGAVILAPNHCNTLMDATVVLQGQKGPIVFGARSDIFNNKTLAKILTFLRILPMVRARDGMREVLRNYDTIDSIVETLDNNVPFCMFCEGTHRPKHSLLPIKKGIFRVAKAANESRKSRAKKKKGKTVYKPSDKLYIVPVGLEYGDYYTYRSSCRMRYGKPIDVTNFFEETKDMPEAHQCELLKQKISDGISKLIVYFPDDEEYDKKIKRFKHLKKVRRDKASGKSGKVRRVLQIIIGFPFFVFSAITALPQWLTSAIICSKVKDHAFHNTVRYGTKLVLTPIVWLVFTILLFCFVPKENIVIGQGSIPWCIPPIIISILAMFSQNIFYDYINLLRRHTGKI